MVEKRQIHLCDGAIFSSGSSTSTCFEPKDSGTASQCCGMQLALPGVANICIAEGQQRGHSCTARDWALVGIHAKTGVSH